MNIAKSSIKLFLANFATAVIQFLGITIFAREIGASELGIFFLFQAILGLLSIPADFGLRGAVEKRVSEGDSPGAYISSAIILKSIPIAVIVLAVIALRPFINRYLGAELAVFLIIAIILQEAAQSTVFILKGELRVGETAVLNVVQYGVWVGLGTIFVRNGYGALGLVYSLLVGISLVLIIGEYKRSIPLSRPSVDHARSLIDYGKFNVISSIGGYFYSWMDIAIIGLFLTQTHVGAYEVAWRVTAVTLLFSKAIATTLLPQISHWDAEGDTDRIEVVVRESLTPSMMLVIPAFFGALVLSRDILGLIFGSEFTIAAVALVILAGEKMLQAIHVVLGRALQAIDRPDLAARATVISVCVNLVLNLVLVHSFGIIGAAVATTTSFAINGILHWKYVTTYINIEIPYSEIGHCYLSAITMATAILIIKYNYEINTLLMLLFIIITGGIIYFIIVIINRQIRLSIYNGFQSLTSRYG